ncbi:MAG: hydroxyethylthiazole kinase [Hyphomicrobiales bacterium]
MLQAKDISLGVDKVRANAPLVHNITNYVVMNNTANALLAIGASPVMAHAIEEVEDMVNIASALVINMGTLSKHWVESMLLAGKAANAKGIPIVFDPVGVGATAYRTDVAKQIIQQCKPDIIRGNASEIMALNNANIATKGVDSTVSGDNALASAKTLAIDTGAVVVISGQTDYITNGKQVAMIHNGDPIMTKVTGMGCTATAILGAFAGTQDNMFYAAIMGMAAMGIAGERANKRSEGPGCLPRYFLNELYLLNANAIQSDLKLDYE